MGASATKPPRLTQVKEIDMEVDVQIPSRQSDSLAPPQSSSVSSSESEGNDDDDTSCDADISDTSKESSSNHQIVVKKGGSPDCANDNCSPLDRRAYSDNITHTYRYSPYNKDATKNRKTKSKESKFIETSEFPYARAKLVHPQTRQECQEARKEARRTAVFQPKPEQQARHVLFSVLSRGREERTTNPHLLMNMHLSGSGINVVPCNIPRRVSDHMPLNTWRDPNRRYTYFRETPRTVGTNADPHPVVPNDVPRRLSDGYGVRPPTPCIPASSSTSGLRGLSEEERKALIRAQYRVELEAIRRTNNTDSRLFTTGHR